MRLLSYIGSSILLTVVFTLLAFVERPNFYSACIAISQSKATVVSFLNLSMLVVLLLGKVFKYIFFGSLWALEIDHLYEHARYIPSEIFLVLVMMKDEFASIKFIMLFTILMFLKVFHWICTDRVDLIFQFATPPDLRAKLRLCAALVTLCLADLGSCYYCISDVLSSSTNGVMVIMFSFEFLLLANSVTKSTAKYILNLIEARFLEQNDDEDSWEPKGSWMFFIDVASDITRLATYIANLIVMLKPSGLILHIIKDIYMTSVSLFKRIRDFARYRRIRAQMDQRIANATVDDLDHDNVCIICREEMVVDGPESLNKNLRYVPKKLLCGHIVHNGCLKGWLERSQSCPICRRPVLDDSTGSSQSWTRWTGVDRNNLATGPTELRGQANEAGRQDDYENNRHSANFPTASTTPTPTIYDNNNNNSNNNSSSSLRPVGSSLGENSGSSGSSSRSDSGFYEAQVAQLEADNPAGHIIVNSDICLPSGWRTFKAKKIDGKIYIDLNAQTQVPVEFDSSDNQIADPPYASNTSESTT